MCRTTATPPSNDGPHGSNSLQQYLFAELCRVADRQTIGEVLEGVEARQGGRVGLQQAVDDLAGERARG